MGTPGLMTLQYLPTVLTVGPASDPPVFRFEQHRPEASTLVVFDGPLRSGEVFSLLLSRRPSDPIGLTVFKDGVLWERFSACCEYG